MADRKFDVRQNILRDVLDQVSKTAGTKADTILSTINSELTMPLRLSAAATPSLVVTVGAAVMANPDNLRNRTVPNNQAAVVDFAGGTVTFPAATANNITFSTVGYTPVNLDCPSNNWVKVLIFLDNAGLLGAVCGTPSAVSAAASVVPLPQAGTMSIGYIQIRNISTVIQVVTNGNIYQFPLNDILQTVGTIYNYAVTKTADYTVLPIDTVIPINTSAAVAFITITLPLVTAAQKGRIVIVKDVGGYVSQSAKYVIIRPNGASNTLEGITYGAVPTGAIRFDIDKMSLTFVCDGVAGWWII